MSIALTIDGASGVGALAEFLDQRLDVRRGVERQQAVIGQRDVVHVRSDRTGQNSRIERHFELGERFGKLRFVRFAQRQQELLVLMLDDQLDERGERAVGKRNLAFAVDDVFLQIERDGFRLATVYRRARSENYGRVRQYFDPLCAELFQRNAYYADKRFIGDLYFVFLG